MGKSCPNSWNQTQCDGLLQLLAQKGIAVWVCDNRSASGKGIEPTWDAYQRMGETELQDIEDGLAWLRREAFGFFLGGTDLEGEEQRYTYFLIRDGGEFILKERRGAESPTLVGWTEHPAILGYEDREEGDVTVRNVLAAEVDPAKACRPVAIS